MVSTQLVEYIRNGISKGHTTQRLYEHLVMHGVDPIQVREAIKYVEHNPSIARPSQPVYYKKPEEKPPGKSHLKIYLILLAVAIIAYLLLWQFTRPSCGNGRIDPGETMDNCCQDTGCLGDQRCQNGRCIDPVCGYCQYIEDYICKRHDCCSSEQCRDDEVCSKNKCVKLECSSCEYVYENECRRHDCCENADCNEDQVCRANRCESIICGPCQFIDHRMCLSYSCCSDSDCDDGNSDTKNICIAPRTLNARCLSVPRTPCTSDSECNDSHISTRDFCDSGKCSADAITACKDGDGYCPSGCTDKNDRDCLKGSDIVDCQEDIQCFGRNLNSCSPAEYISRLGDDLIFSYSIKGIEGNFCRIYHLAKKNPIEDFEGSYYDCYIPSDNLDIKKYDQFISEYMMERCTGSYIQLLQESRCIQYSLSPGGSVSMSGFTIRLIEIKDEEVIVDVSGVSEEIPLEKSRYVNGVKISYVASLGAKALIAIECDDRSI